MLNYINNLFLSSPTQQSTTDQSQQPQLITLTQQQQNKLIDTIIDDKVLDDEYIFINNIDTTNDNNKFIAIDPLHALSDSDDTNSPTITRKHKSKTNNNNSKLTQSICDNPVITQLYSKINEIEQQIQLDELYNKTNKKFITTKQHSSKTNKKGKTRVTDEILFGCY